MLVNVVCSDLEIRQIKMYLYETFITFNFTNICDIKSTFMCIYNSALAFAFDSFLLYDKAILSYLTKQSGHTAFDGELRNRYES